MNHDPPEVLEEEHNLGHSLDGESKGPVELQQDPERKVHLEFLSFSVALIDCAMSRVLHSSNKRGRGLRCGGGKQRSEWFDRSPFTWVVLV